jgi:ABC-type multidrug transport system ATPase subunit
MPGGVDTVLGDRGVNLSGGQKTRLAIARALYSNTDIYLLDDPISALDIHVGKKVMEEGFLKYLSGKTRIIATHALAYLPYFDFILVMVDGKIAVKGTYEEITKSQYFEEIQALLKKTENKEEESSIDDVPELKEEISKKISAISMDKNTEPKHEEEVQAPVTKTAQDAVIENIISSEDRKKGNVITWALIKKYAYYSNGFSLYIFAVLCRLRLS